MLLLLFQCVNRRLPIFLCFEKKKLQKILTLEIYEALKHELIISGFHEFFSSISSGHVYSYQKDESVPLGTKKNEEKRGCVVYVYV